MTNKNTPIISITIPHFNNPTQLHQCLVSISKSTFKDYEVIVIDDGSPNPPLKKSLPLINQLIKHKNNRGRHQARRTGLKHAHGQIIVNIDSDVLIQPHTLSTIAKYFSNHPQVSAITGPLSSHSPHPNFSSTYKNLYMHYRFIHLPKQVTFLYGSIYAIRKKVLQLPSQKPIVDIADDTELGQHLHRQGHTIHLLKNLQVTHLKHYTLTSLIKNDFHIPFNWAQIFLTHQHWQQLGKNHTGFAHASKSQILSLFLAPLTTINFLLSFFHPTFPLFTLLTFTSWFILNLQFFFFIFNRQGIIFSFKSLIFTFLDHHIMLSGIICGSIHHVQNQIKSAH